MARKEPAPPSLAVNTVKGETVPLATNVVVAAK
jgi:hypothetical protein